MNPEKERELFDQARKEVEYYNDFGCKEYDIDELFDKFMSIREQQGYKLAPVEPSDHMKCVVRDFGPDIEDYEKMNKHKWESLCSDIYKAMIGACDEH